MQTDYKIYMEELKPRKIKNSQEETYATRYQDFKNATVIKIVYDWHRDKQIFQWNRVEKLKTDLSKYRSLMNKRILLHISWEGMPLYFIFYFIFFRKEEKESLQSLFPVCSSCSLSIPGPHLHHLPLHWDLS